MKQVIRGETGQTEIVLPRIQVQLFQEKDEEDEKYWQTNVEIKKHERRIDDMLQDEAETMQECRNYREYLILAGLRSAEESRVRIMRIDCHNLNNFYISTPLLLLLLLRR